MGQVGHGTWSGCGPGVSTCAVRSSTRLEGLGRKLVVLGHVLVQWVVITGALARLF